jgi:Prokaryotic RING finger family 1
VVRPTTLHSLASPLSTSDNDGMECLGVFFLIFAGVIAFLVIMAARAQSRADRWNQAFTGAARRFGGDLKFGGWFSYPQLRINYGSTFARLTTYTIDGSRGPRCLELVIQFPDARFRCEVLPKPPSWQLISETPGLFSVDFRWDDLRHRWQMLTDDGDEARTLLSAGVRWQLEQLWEGPEHSEVALSIRPGWMLLRKKWTSTRPLDIEQFVELGLTLFDQAALTRTAGIEFIDEGAVQVLDQAQCRVCGDGMDNDIVYCRRCKTPHHRECWEYNGVCSTYGCREVQYLLPRRVGALSDDAAASPFPKPAKPR